MFAISTYKMADFGIHSFSHLSFCFSTEPFFRTIKSFFRMRKGFHLLKKKQNLSRDSITRKSECSNRLTSESIVLVLSCRCSANEVFIQATFHGTWPMRWGSNLLKNRRVDQVHYAGHWVISKHSVIAFSSYSWFRKNVRVYYLPFMNFTPYDNLLWEQQFYNDNLGILLTTDACNILLHNFVSMKSAFIKE